MRAFIATLIACLCAVVLTWASHAEAQGCIITGSPYEPSDRAVAARAGRGLRHPRRGAGAGKGQRQRNPQKPPYDAVGVGTSIVAHADRSAWPMAPIGAQRSAAAGGVARLVTFAILVSRRSRLQLRRRVGALWPSRRGPGTGPYRGLEPPCRHRSRILPRRPDHPVRQRRLCGAHALPARSPVPFRCVAPTITAAISRSPCSAAHHRGAGFLVSSSHGPLSPMMTANG